MLLISKTFIEYVLKFNFLYFLVYSILVIL